MGRSETGELKKSYLIWDAGFARGFCSSLLAILVAALAFASQPDWRMQAWEYYQEFLFWLMEGANRMAWWSVIGLLSSSCCALQLLLNCFNFGCAGFNTVLGPVRPFLCAGTLCIQGAVWHTALDKPFQWLYVAPCTAVAVVLTLLPEIMYLWMQRKRTNPSESSIKPSSRLVLSLEGMGCIACTKKVNEVLTSTGPLLLSSEILFEQKEVKIALALNADEARSTLVPDLLKRIEEAGFVAAVKSVELIGVETESNTNKAAENKDAIKGKSCCSDTAPPTAFAGGSSGLLISVFSGLLSSSCCLLQLGLNLLATLNWGSAGCAGFNKVLGPHRWMLRLLTLGWLAVSWMYCACKRWRKSAVARLALQSLVCLLLTFLPEMLVSFGGPALAPAVEGSQVIQVKVDGMGCEACQLHVQGMMDNTGGVLSSHVDFEKGHAELLVNKEWAFDFNDMAKRLKADGYEATLKSEF